MRNLKLDKYCLQNHLKALNNLAKSTPAQNINIILDIDAGIGRTGIAFHQAVDLAIKIHKLPHLSLKGIQCYAGHYQHIAKFHLRKDASYLLLKKC